jgi:hypothetical protein
VSLPISFQFNNPQQGATVPPFRGCPRAAPDTIRRKTPEDDRPADLELIDYNTNEPMFFRIL